MAFCAYSRILSVFFVFLFLRVMMNCRQKISSTSDGGGGPTSSTSSSSSDTTSWTVAWMSPNIISSSIPMSLVHNLPLRNLELSHTFSPYILLSHIITMLVFFFFQNGELTPFSLCNNVFVSRMSRRAITILSTNNLFISPTSEQVIILRSILFWSRMPMSCL